VTTKQVNDADFPPFLASASPLNKTDYWKMLVADCFVEQLNTPIILNEAAILLA
jgi:hypothetical protein